MKQGIIIPVYNHGRSAGRVVAELGKYEIPIIVIDDGSNEETKDCLHDIVRKNTLVDLITLDKNTGKGGAVCAGIDRAYTRGLSHVLQIDADGQHDVSRVGFFLQQSGVYPENVICSYPEYDDTVPSSRKNGRIVGNTMAKIVTLSGDIIDSMCGFRVYPVAKVYRLIHRYNFDYRMGFDIEILVRLHWTAVPLTFFPVNVIYPADNISHFHLIRDNARISWVFTRLFFGMLVRLPSLLFRLIKKRGRQ